MSSQKPIAPMDDEAPDAWLKGALLHAPDAQADAPAALTHNILRESRLALESVLAVKGAARDKPLAATPERMHRAHWLMAAWHRLTRPQVAAGFASVMVATLAGVLWWDKPLDERGDPPMTAAAPSPQAAPAPTPAPAAPAVSPPTAEADRASNSVAQAVPSRRAELELARGKDASASHAERPAKPAGESTTRAKLADAARLEEPKREARRESTPADTVAAESVAAAPANAPPPSPAAVAPPSPAMPAQIAAPAPAPATDMASAKVGRDDSAAFAAPPQSRSAATQSAQRAAPSAATAAPAPAATGNALTTQPASPFSGLLAAVTTSPEQWRWQADGGEPQAVTPALLSWLRLLDQSAGSRWATGGSLGGSAVDSAAPSLRLTSDTSSARIVLAGNSVTLQRAGALWTVVLTPQAAEALRKAWADKLR